MSDKPVRKAPRKRANGHRKAEEAIRAVHAVATAAVGAYVILKPLVKKITEKVKKKARKSEPKK